MPSWWLEDAQKRAEEFPYTFYKPPAKIISKLKPKQIVKLIFGFQSDDPESPGAERMWVIIDSVKGDVFKGTLDNEPAHILDLHCGDPIKFEARHIIAIDDVTEPTDHDKYFLRCYVANPILEDNKKAKYIYKEEPDEDKDSGWRIMQGDETDEMLGDSQYFSYVAIGAVLNKDNTFVHLLDLPFEIGFEWNEDLKKWIKIEEDDDELD